LILLKNNPFLTFSFGEDWNLSKMFLSILMEYTFAKTSQGFCVAVTCPMSMDKNKNFFNADSFYQDARD
jgi:hypothetical protein